MTDGAWRVFYSYSHQDTPLRKELAKFLAPLSFQNKIIEWYDRDIAPGADWDAEISSHLESANLILLLVTADFLASKYCFGVEIERAMARKKLGDVEVVPILLRDCLWDESRFSALQMIPRDARNAKPVMSWSSADEAFKAVASEIKRIVSAGPPPHKVASSGETRLLAPSLELVREQVQSYARLYEITRQRMPGSSERTVRMEQIFDKMRSIATASYPLLDELVQSPSPGDRLAAVAILQVCASERFLSFLVKLVGSEKPFVSYHAIRAMHFAASSTDPKAYPQISETLREAEKALDLASAGFNTDRRKVLRAAKEELERNIEALSLPSRYD